MNKIQTGLVILGLVISSTSASPQSETFDTSLSKPGLEYAAIRIALPSAAEHLTRLQSPPSNALPASVSIVKADLLLTLDRKAEALTHYRDAADHLRNTQPEHYPVEPTRLNQHAMGAQLLPFVIGPGSHRDNLLIRRFIALDALDEAQQEFERIHELHKQRLAQRVAPQGYDGRALQFVIDYAYFLKRSTGTDLCPFLRTRNRIREPVPASSQKAIISYSLETSSEFDVRFTWMRDF